MRGLHKLTKAAIEKAEAGRHSDGGGLYLFVSGDSKRWVWRYWRGTREAGRLTELGLGSLRDVSPAAARAMAARMREALVRGEDPKDVRAPVARAPTFGEIADDYIATMKPTWKGKKHAAQWDMTMREYAKALREKPVNRIVVQDVLAVLRPLWSRVPETASRVRGRIELVLDAAAAGGYRSPENPARWRGNLKHLLPPRKKLTRGHMAAISYQEAPAIVARLRGLESVSALALEWTILTISRTEETTHCAWDELDLDARVWTIPKERMKGKREHRVPLTGRCVEIARKLEKVATTAPWVFPGQQRGKPLSDMAMLMCLRGIAPGYTVHGFRSTFRDWAGDATETPREIVEAALAHVIGDKAEQAYRRGDALERRRKLMEAWSAYCDPSTQGNVVRLRG